MNNPIKQLAILVLVAGIMVQPMTGMALADTGDVATGGECYLRGDAGFWGGFLGLDVAQCQTPAQDAGENQVDVYAGMVSNYDKEKLGTTNYQNQLTYSRNIVLCQVKADTIESMQNGENISTAKSNVNATIDEHYSSVRYNVIQSHNSQLNQYWYLLGVAESAGNQADGSTTAPRQFYATQSNWAPHTTQDDINQTTVTLDDGTTVNATYIIIHDTSNGALLDPFSVSELSNTDTGEEIIVGDADATLTSDASVAKSSSDYVALYHEQAWMDVWSEIDSEQSYVQNNSMQYVDDVYATYNASDFSDVDAQELHSACSLNTLGTDKDSTGSLSWARASAAVAGYDTNVNNSFTIEYTPAAGETFVGDTSVTASTPDINMSNPTIGNNAIVTGTETFRVDLAGTNISSPEIVLHSTADDSVVTSMALSDTDGDGTYRAALPAGNYSTLSNGDTVTPAVEATADGTSTRIDIGTWTYAPNGGTSVELDGALYTDWKPAVTNSSFVANQSYDTANAGGESVIFLDTDGVNKGYHTLDGTFTISSMYNPTTGESVTSTTTEDYNTQTTDASLTLEEVQKLLDWRDQYKENWNPTVTIGGGGGIFSGLGTAIGVGGLLILGVLGFAVYIYLEGKNGGNGGGGGKTYIVTNSERDRKRGGR